MKLAKYLIFLLGVGTSLYAQGQGVLLTKQQATDTLMRIFLTQSGDELITSKVVTEMYYTDAPSTRIDSMYYEVMSMKGNHYITIDHDVSYMHNKLWNVTVYRQQKQIVIDSLVHGQQVNSFMENPFSIYQEFLEKPNLKVKYYNQGNVDTSRLTIQGSEDDIFNEVKLFYLATTGILVRGEYILPLPEQDIPVYSDTAVQSVSVPQNRAYLMKMHYEHPSVSSTSGTFFSETSFFIRHPDGSYHPSSHFPGYRVIRRESIAN